MGQTQQGIRFFDAGKGGTVTGRRRFSSWFPGGALLLLPMLFILFPAASEAVLVGSRHDFSSDLKPFGGQCAACHLPHKTQDRMLIWPRNLTTELNYFSQTPWNSKPNYSPLATVLCYVCHINALNISPTPDGDPLPAGGWTVNEYPQDTAFTDGPASPPANSQVGYYELGRPNIGTVPTGTNKPPVPPANPPVTTSTGGHFWKLERHVTKPGSFPFGLGDKLDCDLCHDPHNSATGTNQVMMRTSVSDGTNTITIGNGLLSSSKSRWHTSGNGRAMCAGCHLYSNSSVAENVLYGVTIPKQPAMGDPGHVDTDTTECTACHPHNAPDCATCHGKPPPEPAVG